MPSNLYNIMKDIAGAREQGQQARLSADFNRAKLEDFYAQREGKMAAAGAGNLSEMYQKQFEGERKQTQQKQLQQDIQNIFGIAKFNPKGATDVYNRHPVLGKNPIEYNAEESYWSDSKTGARFAMEGDKIRQLTPGTREINGVLQQQRQDPETGLFMDAYEPVDVYKPPASKLEKAKTRTEQAETAVVPAELLAGLNINPDLNLTFSQLGDISAARLKAEQTLKAAKGQGLSSAERKSLTDTNVQERTMDDYKNLFEKNKSSLGPAFGRWNFQIFDKAGGKGLDKASTDYFAAEAAIFNQMIKMITGAQVRESEEKRILRQVPTHSDVEGQWNSKWEQTKKNIKFLQEEIRRIGETGKINGQQLTPQQEADAFFRE